MRKQILFFFLTFSLGLITSYGQEALTYKIMENFNSDTQQFTEVFKEEYSYNSKGELEETQNSYWMSIAWVPASKITYTYNSNGYLTESIRASYNDATKSYTNSFRQVLSYPDNKITSDITYTWANGAWRPEDKTEFAYNGDNISSFNSFEWNGTQWIDDDRGTLSYVNNKISEVISEEFENNSWGLSYKIIYFRNPSTGKIDDIIYQEWKDNAWINEDKTNFIIDTSGNRMVETYYESPDGIAWVEDEKIDYNYDKSALMSNYRNPFNLNAYQNDIDIDDFPYYNKIISEVTSDNDDDSMPLGGAATWETESRITYYYSDQTMGLDDLSDTNLISIYPNPVQNTLNIKLKNLIKANASIFDVNGRKVLEQKIQSLNTSLNIEALNSGLYVLKIHSDQGFTAKQITKH